MPKNATLDHQIEEYLKQEAPASLRNASVEEIKALLVRLAPEPTVVVRVDGGLIVDATANIPAKVHVLDADIEGGDPENIVEIQDEEYYVSTFTLEADSDDVRPAEVEEISEAIAAFHRMDSKPGM